MITCTDQHELIVHWVTGPGFQVQLRLQPWSRGMDAVSRVNGEQEGHDPLDDLGIPLAMVMREPAARPWVQQLPAAILPALLQFETRYPGKTYPLLWYGCRYGWVIDLLLSEPLVLALLLHCAQRERWRPAQIHALGQSKRTAILAACGFPGHSRVRNLLRKLHLERLGAAEYHCLTQALGLPESAQLSHLPYLDLPLLQALVSDPRIAHSRWLRSYHAGWDWPLWRAIVPDLRAMGSQLGLADLEQRLARCPHLPALQRLHDRLALQLNAKEPLSTTGAWFPPPPVMGNSTIVPILHAGQLQLEGRSQRHCVASYGPRIRGGRYYVYRVLAPERATLGLYRQGATWQMDQLRLQHNQSPAAATLAAVAAWLRHTPHERPETGPDDTATPALGADPDHLHHHPRSLP